MTFLRRYRRGLGSFLFFLTAFWQIGQPLQAATFLWDSNTGLTQVQDGAGTWTSAGTTWWNPAGAGSNVAITSADIGLFGAGGVGGAITLSGNQSLLGMIFGQTATTGYSFTAGSATTLTLGASGITVLQGAQPVTIGDANLSLVLGAAQTWVNRSSGALTIGGGINGGANTLTLNGVAGVTTLGQYTLNGALTGTGGLTLGRNASATITADSTYSGATAIGNASTLTVSGAAGRISATSGITLNGGNLTMLSATGEQAVDRVNAAAITSNGGTITWNNPAGDAGTWAETLGVLSTAKGLTNIVNTNAVSGTQFLTLGTGSLTRPGGSTATIAFSGTSVGGAQNRIFVTGQANTAANQIIGPWATLGTAAGAQTDYAIYTASGIAARNVAATAQTTWTTAANTYTMNAAQTLTATRTINSIRNSGAALALDLGASTFNLATYGILNGGTGALTVSTTGTGGVTTPTGGDQTLYLIGGNNTINVTAPIIDNGTAVNVVKSGNSTVTLGNSANSYTGVTTINAGTLTISTTGNGGVASTLGASSNAAANLVIAGGTLSYSAAASTAGSTDRLFTLTEAGGTINNSGSNNNALTFAGTGSLVASGTGDRTLNLTAGGTGTFTFSPVIVNPTTGTTSLVTSAGSTGVIVLLPSAANTFTGGIIIQNRTLQVRTANGWGSNVISFGSGTTPTLELRSNAAVNFATGFTNGLDFGNNTGIVSLSAVSASNAVTHTIGTVTIGSGTFQFNRGSNLNTNFSSSLTTGAVTLTGNPTFNLNAGSGSATYLLTLGALDDGGVARTITITGGAAGTGRQQLRFLSNATTFTAGTNIVYNGGNMGGLRLEVGNGFGTATNLGLVTFTAPTTVGGVRLLNNAATTFNTNWVLGNNSVLFDVGGTAASQTTKTHTSGTLSIGTATLSLTQVNANTNNVHSLSLGATTLTGDSAFDLQNINGTGIGSLILGALNDGAVARTLTKSGAATLQLNTAATSIIAGTTLTTTAGITQIGNANAFGAGTLNVGNGTTTGQLRIADTITLSNNTIVTYLGGTATLGTGSITGPATGTGTINSTINLDAAPGADTGHFQGGGGTLSITGPIVTGGTSGGEVVVRAGNVNLDNATGNTYTSLRVNAGTTTVGVSNAIPAAANVFLADVGATAAINIGAGLSQTIGSTATWTLGGSGPTLENNVGTIATGTGTLVLNGTIANNTGSLATQLVTGSLSFGGTSGTFNIDSGHATSDMTVSANLSNGSLIKDGAGILTLTGTKTLTDLTINGGSVLGGYGTGGVQTITVGAAGSLQLVNSLAETLTLAGSAGSLNVAGGARIGLELGAPLTSDLLTVGTGGTAATTGTITLDFYNLGGLAAGTYNLLSAPSGLTAGGTTYNVGSAPLGFNYTINATDTLVQLTTTAYTPRFWTDSQATGLWSTSNAGPVTNWSTDAAGATNSADTPTSTHTVIFSATNAPGSPTITSTVDAAFTIDALQFLAAPVGVTAVNIGQSGVGALTVAPATSSAGIFVDTNAGIATLGAALPYTVGANQTWNVVGGGANGSALVVAGNVTFTNAVTKSGAGALTLSGTNGGAGALTLSAGTLNLNSVGALGAGTFTINGGTTINNSTGGALTMAANNPVTLNGNFTFAGTQALNLGTGAISLPTNVSITSNGSNLTLGGVITETGTRSLTKLGTGALTLTNDNAFSGGLNLNAGTLNLANAGALGTGTFTIVAGTLDNTSGGAMTLADNNAQTWNGNFAFAGSNNLNLGTGAISLGAAAGTSRVVTVAAGTLEVGGVISNGAVGTGITKLGNGTLVLAGASNYTGNTVVNAGTLNLTGSLTGNGTTTAGSALQLGTVAGNSVVNIGGDISTYNTFTGGGITGANTAINMTSGTASFTTTSTGDAVNLVSSAASGAYGSLSITGGTMNTLGRMQVGRGSGGGVAYIGGTGTLNATGEWFMVAYGNTNALGSLTIGPGGTLNRTGATNYLGVFMNQAGQYGILNLTGGTLITTGGANLGLRLGNGNGGTNNTGFLNLAGGIFQTSSNVTQSVGTSTGQNAYINLAGATIQSLGGLSAALPVTVTGQTVTTTLYGAIDNVGTAQDFTGGFTFDSNGFNSTIASTILAPTADGVAQTSLSVTGGSGYIGAPVVQFTGGTLAAGGAPASGYAVVSGGAVTEIVITAPGSYTVAPTVTLTGGGGSGASVAVGALVTNTTTAGITKNGAGNLTLNGTGSTYTGPVTINGGSLTVGGGLANIGSTSPLGTGDSTSTATNAGSIVLNGGTLATNIGAATTTDRLFTVTELGGALASNNTTAANTITWNNVNPIAYSGTGNRTLTFDGANPVAGINTFAPLIGDAGGTNVVTLNKTGVSNWHLTNASNAYTGGTNIAAGVLTFDAGALGTTGNITYTGTSTLRWGTSTTTDLSSRLFIADTFTGTVDTGANNVVFANAVGTTGGTTGILNKTGAGALTLNAAATHTGGTTLTAGTLNLGIAGAVGTGTLTLAGGTLDNTSGGLLTLTNGQSWSGNFTFAGTNNLTMNTGAINLTADRTVTVTAGTLTVENIIGDGGLSRNFTKAGAGTLYLKGANTFGVDDNFTIQGGTVIVDAASGLGDATNNVFFTGAGTLRFTDNATFGANQYFRVDNTGATIEVDATKLVEIAGGGVSAATNGINTNGGTDGAGASLIKTGLGTLRISGGNGFFDGDGGWVVTQGTLSIAGSNTSVLGDATPATVALRLNGGTVSYDTDTANIVNAAIGTVLQANSTVVSNVATAGAGISQSLNALTVNAGGLTLNVAGGSNVNSGTAGTTTGAVTLNGDVTFNITDPTGGGITQLSIGAVTGGANGVSLTGNGDFVQTGVLASSAASSLTLNSGYSGLATLSQANTYSGLTTVNGGTLAFSTSGNLGDAAATNDITLGGGVLQFTPATTVDLTANRQINLTSATTSTVEVTSATGVLQVTGGFATTAASNLTKTGLGTLEVTGALDLNGGNLSVNAGTMRSGLATNGVGTLSIASGATLNMYDSATSTANLTGLTLAAGSNLGFDLNAPGVNDFLNLTGTPSITSAVSVNFNNLGGLAIGTYDLLTISSGTLNASNFMLGLAPSGFNYGFSTVGGNQTLRLTASTLNLVYWRGDVDGNWNTNNTGDTNWASNASGATDLGALPVATDTLVFSAQNAVGPAITTSLNNVGVTADSLRFISAPTTPATTSVTIASGGASGILTVQPASANNGITVAASGGDVTISAPVVAAANQTWEVDGTAPSSLIVSGDVTFTGSVAKTGAGSLTLSGTNSGAGGVNLVAGTLNIGSATALGTGAFTVGNGTTFTNSTAGALTLSTNNLQTWGGSFTFGGSQNLDLGTGAVTMGNTLTAIVNNTLTVGGGIDDGASTFALTKSGAGTLVLNGANNYDGLTTLSAGTLTLAGNNSGAAGGVTMAATTTLNIDNNNALGATAGTFTINGGTINNTSGSAVVNAGNNAQNWNSSFTFTGANALDLGTGAVTLSVTPTVTVSASTLTVGGVIDGAFGLTKAGTGTLTLTGLSGTPANNYSGTTILNNGTTNITTAASFSGGLTFGANNGVTTASTLNLTSGATFAGALLAQTRTTTANTISVSSGQTLTINGNVTIGAADPGAAASTTRLDIGGGGNLVVSTAAAGLFQVGGSTNGTNSLNSIMDLTGLASATINVSATGTVRVNQPNGTNLAGNQSSLLLPTPVVAPNTPVTTITAANFNVGDNGGNGAGAGQQNSVTFGTGLTTLNVNTVNVGTGGRDFGELVYAAGNGTLQLRAADGTSRAAFNVGTGAAVTGVAAGTGVTNNVNFNGHSSDLLISTLTIGGQNRQTNRTDTFSFDTGTLDATAMIVGDNGGTAGTASSNTWTSTLNIGGGTTTIGTGGLEIARGDTAVTGSDIIAGTVNISGGTVTIADSPGLGAAVRLGHNTIAPGASVLTTTGLLNITGGTVTVSGNIIKGAITGPGSATVTLNGGTLDMSSNSIGAAGALAVTFDAQSGTLQNLAQLNGGGTLTKSTGGTLILQGTNAYTGGTAIDGGILQVNSIGGNSLNSTGNISFGGGTLQYTANDTSDYSSRIVNSTAGAVNIDTNGQNVTFASSLAASNTSGLAKHGAGTLTLTAASNYSGGTALSAGTLLVSNATGSATGSGAVTTVATTILGGTGIIAPGSGSAVTVNGTLQVGGTSPGAGQTLTVATNAAALTINNLLTFDLFSGQATGTLNGATHADRLLLTGHSGGATVALGGSSILEITTGLITTSGWTAGSSWQLIDWAGLTPTGTFSNLTGTIGNFANLPDLSSQLLGWDVSNIYTTGIVSIAVVPEPSRALLLMFGFLAFFMRRRR